MSVLEDNITRFGQVIAQTLGTPGDDFALFEDREKLLDKYEAMLLEYKRIKFFVVAHKIPVAWLHKSSTMEDLVTKIRIGFQRVTDKKFIFLKIIKVWAHPSRDKGTEFVEFIIIAEQTL